MSKILTLVFLLQWSLSVWSATDSCETSSLLENIQDLQKVSSAGTDILYESMKKKFEASAFCDPANVVNNPQKQASGVLLNAAFNDLVFLGRADSNKLSQFRSFADKYELSTSLRTEVERIVEKPDQGFKVRSLIIQEITKKSKANPKYQQKRMREELLADHIFSQDENGEIVCPFVSKDAFEKALKGREAILSANPSAFKNRNILTIVDYTRPSNERRMFVLDLKNRTVMHNTWVAHGLGGKSGKGVDGAGSAGPMQMSNESGSKKSSDGFIIAQDASHGAGYGNNVVLKGIDVNNSNIAARSVVLHGWRNPYSQYATSESDYAEKSDVEKGIRDFRSNVAVPPYLDPTEGCLGVPVINVKHLDRKGRDQTQLEMLREDLPGSLILNYSGPEMESKYF